MSLLNKWLQNLISLKGLVLISGILLLTGFIRPDSFLVLERWYFQLGQDLSSPGPQASDIALIQLKPESVLQLQSDPGQSDLLPLLLQRSALVGLVLDRPLREEQVAAERMLNLLGTSKSEPDMMRAWQEHNRRALQFQQRLQQGDVLLGLTDSGVSALPEHAYPIKRIDSLPWGALSWLPGKAVAWMRHWTDRYNGLQLQRWPVDPQLHGAAYRAVDKALVNGPRQLIWEQKSQPHPGLALALV